MVSFALCPLYRLGKGSQYFWIGGWVGPKSDLDAGHSEEEENQLSLPGINGRS
jgi:hypothetical protein